MLRLTVKAEYFDDLLNNFDVVEAFLVHSLLERLERFLKVDRRWNFGIDVLAVSDLLTFLGTS